MNKKNRRYVEKRSCLPMPRAVMFRCVEPTLKVSNQLSPSHLLRRVVAVVRLLVPVQDATHKRRDEGSACVPACAGLQATRGDIES